MSATFDTLSKSMLHNILTSCSAFGMASPPSFPKFRLVQQLSLHSSFPNLLQLCSKGASLIWPTSWLRGTRSPSHHDEATPSHCAFAHLAGRFWAPNLAQLLLLGRSLGAATASDWHLAQRKLPASGQLAASQPLNQPRPDRTAQRFRKPTFPSCQSGWSLGGRCFSSALEGQA